MNYGMTPKSFKQQFINKASTFASVPPSSKVKKTNPKPNRFAKAIYGSNEQTSYTTIESEINCYLSDCDRHRGDILLFWKGKEESLPGLAKMAKMYLAIPATSTPSEGAFSKTKRILGPQRASLAPASVEILLSLKEWFRLFGPMYFPHKLNSTKSHIVMDDDDDDDS